MQTKVKKREVFYLHGYDPRGAKTYHSLYKEHLIKQNDVNKINASVSKREKKDGYSSWDIRAHEDGIQTDTKYVFLSWTDIVLKNWSKTILEILFHYFYSVNAHILKGLLYRYTKLAPYMLLIGSYSVLYIFFMFTFSLYLGYVGAFCFLEIIPFYISFFLALIIIYTTLKVGIFVGDKIGVFWLFNIYTFTAKWGRGKLPEIDTKMDVFVDRIYTSLQDAHKNNVDEVLIVAHSVGSMLCVPITARLISKCKENNVDILKLKLLTLGGDIPLISLHKGSGSYRADLEYLAKQKNFVWLDYSSKIDGTCFPMVDPILSAGVAREKDTGLVLLSTKFYKLFTKESYKKLRYKWFDVHFWYLMSSEIAGEYDYFKMTAGSKPLESRIKEK